MDDANFGRLTLQPDLLVGGDWRPAESGARFEVFDPAFEAVIGSAPDATVADALRALDAADAAAAQWRATAPRTRAAVLRRAGEDLMGQADAFARLIVLENGKTLADAQAEVRYAADFFLWFAEEAVRAIGEIGQAPASGARILVNYQPVGTALLVTPWNFPAAMAARKIAPALAAGCTCVLKPAEDTPLTAYALARLLQEAGVPDGVVNVVSTTRPGEIVSALLASPKLRKLSFTGSTEVGRRLLAGAAPNVIRCSMELGGNAPFIVFDDADLDAAVEGAMIAKMRNGGQACTAANRFYVQENLHDAFVEALSGRMASMPMGSGLGPDVEVGPLINLRALTRVEVAVEAAVAAGATVHAGARRRNGKGWFYAPTVLSGLKPGSPLMRQEIFGPVAPVASFKDEAEAVALANDTEFGLAAYLYTGDLTRGLRVAEALECGMTAINRGLLSDPAAPFGGVKHSGLGREGGHLGLLEYLEPRYVSVNW